MEWIILPLHWTDERIRIMSLQHLPYTHLLLLLFLPQTKQVFSISYLELAFKSFRMKGEMRLHWESAKPERWLREVVIYFPTFTCPFCISSTYDIQWHSENSIGASALYCIRTDPSMNCWTLGPIENSILSRIPYPTYFDIFIIDFSAFIYKRYLWGGLRAWQRLKKAHSRDNSSYPWKRTADRAVPGWQLQFPIFFWPGVSCGGGEGGKQCQDGPGQQQEEWK